MRWIGAVVCCLLAGSISALRELDVNVGEDFDFTVVAVLQTITACHLTPPRQETLDFYPDQPSQHERYTLQPIEADSIMPSCVVIAKSLMESDEGVWEISYTSASGSSGAEMFNITVVPVELDDGIAWLNSIDFPTRNHQYIDISLSLKLYKEDCYIRKPGGEDVKFSEANIDGVTVHDSSEFVSCRVTVGPMEESLLGDWTLCGKHTDNGKEIERCQLARITWNNNDSNRTWDTYSQTLFDHVVNYGGTLTPVVLGTGDLVTCHVITPNGEDLVIGQDSEYPHLSLVPADSSTCSVAIGPMKESLLGNWTLYGKFRHIITGLNEERLPMNLFLYDEGNPYEQAYNVTVINTIRRVVNLGYTLNVEVTGTGLVDSCQFKTPSGDVYDLDTHLDYDGASFVDIGMGSACRLAIGPTTAQSFGDWEVIGKFSNNGRYTEIQQVFHVLEEDPENPIIEDRKVEYLTEQSVNSKIGNSHRLIIHSNIFVLGESCHIRTPDGLQYTIMDGFTGRIPGVEVIEESGVECGVLVSVLTEDAVGTWTLIARTMRHSEAIERRLPFTINVEEIVSAMPNAVTILEGIDLHVRLRQPTDQHDTCKLIRPEVAISPHIVDPAQVESCGYIVENVTTSDSGIWEIVYGSRIMYRAPIVVNVTVHSESTESSEITIDLVLDRPAAKVFGPEDAVYCYLEDPQGVTVFDDFGRCNLVLDRVTHTHQGYWKMMVGSPGKVIAVEHSLRVYVKESEGKPLVTTHVEKQQPIVAVSCAVATEAEVKACKFRDPQGRILLASSGVAEDRYVFHGQETSYQSGVKSHECGLAITDPHVDDLGLWRCAIETEEDTYYGFLPVLCPWALQDPVVAASVQQVPILSATNAQVSGVEAQPITMACTVEAAIRYCYFRAQNGTTFAVSPGTSSPDMEYVGAGLDAGECGVRFHGPQASDSGRWSCHVGLVDDHEEQSQQITLQVHERMRTDHYFKNDGGLVVQGTVYEGREVEYCRFVRIDGFGFTNENVPSEYHYDSIASIGQCRIIIYNPTILDLHPWTVAAKIHGQDEEITRQTEVILFLPEEPWVIGGQRGLSIFFYVFLSVLLLAIILGAWLGPKERRQWTYSRASALRQSLRNSFRKQPLPDTPVDQRV